MEVGSQLALLAAPVLHMGKRVGHIFLPATGGGGEFSREDEETLVAFASQAALVIANARRYRDELRARADLETLMDTAPVGVVVFDARTGAPVSVNREMRRIVDSLRTQDQPPEQLLEVLIVRRDDGTEISLEELSLAQELSGAETVRAEEIVLRVPDGRSLRLLLDGTPIRAGAAPNAVLPDALADVPEAGQLLGVQIEQLAGDGPPIAHDRGPRGPRPARAAPPPQHLAHGRGGTPQPGAQGHRTGPAALARRADLHAS